MDTRTIKTRFAPSPTGLLHLGNIRTALFCFLLARHQHGQFLLRLEDTDIDRSNQEFTDALKRDLKWLGLVWDEGPDVGGENGPYVQSERGAIYKKYFESLEQTGKAYPCFCSEQELKISRKTTVAAGKPPRYSGKCRGLRANEIQEYLAEGRKATLRFRVESGSRVEFEDGVRGAQHFNTDEIGDFIIRRSNGTPAFFFSNAVDDALMGVTWVVRGEDHLSNTPRQILLLESLSLPVPEYAHIALVVGNDGVPLSKRNGGQTVVELREQGFLPAAILNYLARLGHTYESNDLIDPEDLPKDFNMTRLHRAPARFDLTQLQYWQKETLRASSEQALWLWAIEDTGRAPPLVDWVPDSDRMAFVRAVRDNIETRDDVHYWARHLYANDIFKVIDDSAMKQIMGAGAGFFTVALRVLEEPAESFREFNTHVSEKTGKKGKSLFMPLRAALTGVSHGPEMDRIWSLLGADRIRLRLQAAYEHC